LVTYAVQLAIISLVFALLFKYLPSTKVEWRDVAVGGLITAVLWLVGQSLLNVYLTRSSFSSYGLIGGVLAFLVYVYYSSQIAFIGGEFTQVYARSHGSMAQPEGQAADAAGATANQPSAVNRALAEARKRELLRKEQELSQAQRRTRSTAASSGAVGLLVGAVLGGVALVVGVARTVGRLRGGGA
jgi:membrane protein